MKGRIYTVCFVTCAFLFSACGNSSPENKSLNINKSANNQNISADAVSITVNENLSFKELTPTPVNAGKKTDFEGTAGITDKRREIKSVAILKEVRTAQHDGYDRITFEFEGAQMPGYRIEYIDEPVRSCGSGDVAPLKGDGWLEIRFQPAQAHSEEGNPTVENRERAANHKIIKELKLTCDFEADVTWVLGVASPNKYRALELKNPTRLAVDIKH